MLRHVPNNMDVAGYINNHAHGDDTYCIRRLDNGLLTAVLDGVSMAEGRHGSRTVGNTLRRRHIRDSSDIERALSESNQRLIDEYTAALAAWTRGGFAPQKASTTVAAVFVTESTINCFSAGDSPIYRLRSSLKLMLPLDRDPHIINWVTNSMGGPDFVLNRRRAHVDRGDTYLLATDGLSDNVDEETIAAILGETRSARGAVNALRDEYQRRRAADEGHLFDGYKHDDVTMVVLRT